MHNIPFNVKAAAADTTAESADDDDDDNADDNATVIAKCPIPIQKETPTGLVDTICQNDVEPNQAGICRWVDFRCKPDFAMDFFLAAKYHNDAYHHI